MDNVDLFLESLADKLNLLNKYAIEFGILTEDGVKTVEIKIVDVDNVEKTISQKLADIAYLTEYGTVKFPGVRVLENSISNIQLMLNDTLDRVIGLIVTKDIDEKEIEENFKTLSFKCQEFLKQMYINSYNSIKTVDDILGIQEAHSYYDLKQLSSCIKCKLIVK